ncbi:hypothetical protein TEA_026990 [Camellia sinensis var. sinensis]|uniref:C2 domain-containing protein n=1 Tax=Camellia sinensis var. sinensis TaxID=542762 RepID=A0A4S4EJM7_CAMSN|nr:hypothetical protein TEA_026990 [Camellia sinensis var. sinensis]
MIHNEPDRFCNPKYGLKGIFIQKDDTPAELEDIRLFGRMKVYAIVSISGGPPTGYNTEFTTYVDMERNNNPKWNTVMDFKLHDPSLRNNLLYLNFNFHCRQTLGDKFIGRVSVPIDSILAMISGKRTASQAVRNPNCPLGPQQSAPQWQPPPPPPPPADVALEAHVEVNYWQSYYTSEPQTLQNQVNYGSNAQVNDDQANQFDDDDQVDDDQGNQFDDDDCDM